jgi:hypothetical protein
MATATVNYSSNQTITMTLANLGTSPTFVAGRECTQIDNTTNKYMDALVSGSISVGSTGMTANTVLAVYVWGSDSALSNSVPLNTLEGSDGDRTLTNVGILNALRLGATVGVPATTNNQKYIILPFSVASLFGGVMPKYWGLFVSQNTGASLYNNSVNNNSFEYVGIKYDVA